MTDCVSFECICIPPGSDDCQVLVWNNTTKQAEWTGKPYQVTSATYYADDCVSVYACGDFCLSWVASIGAISYNILENSVTIAQGITSTSYVVTSNGSGSRTLTIVPVSCAGIEGDGFDVVVNDINCVSTCLDIVTNSGCNKDWAGTPFNFGSSCDPALVSANFNLPTGAYTYTLNACELGTIPQHAGAVWSADLYIDGLFAGSLDSGVLIDPGEIVLTGSISGSISIGSHLFEVRMRQISGVGGYPNTNLEQKNFSAQICPF